MRCGKPPRASCDRSIPTGGEREFLAFAYRRRPFVAPARIVSTTAFVAVPDPQSNTGANDRLDMDFPTLFRDSGPGYGLVYQNNTWRVFGLLNIGDPPKR
jgi:hypothetical protein